MINGVLVAESLRIDHVLDDVELVIRTIKRSNPRNITAAQPRTWTLVDFEAVDDAADGLTRALSTALDDQPAWYADFRSAAETFVVFPGRIFRYPRGDQARRAEACAHGRRLGIPESQLDWSE